MPAVGGTHLRCQTVPSLPPSTGPEARRTSAQAANRSSSASGTANEQLSQIVRDYDGSYTAIADLGSSSKSTYCATTDGTAVRAELKRYQSGYFDAKTASPSEGFDSAKLWAGQGDKRGGR